MFEAAVDGFGGAVAGVGVVEVGQDVPGSAFECSAQRYGSMSRREAKELRELREQNARLKQLLGQAELEKAALRDLAEGNWLFIFGGVVGV